MMRKLFSHFGLCLGGCMFLATTNAQVPLVMDMTGTPALGQDVTIAFKDGAVPVGTFFDIWICGEEAQIADRRPDDNLDDLQNASCTSLNFWLRIDVNPAPTAITFLMTDANYDAENEGFGYVDVRDPDTGAVVQAADDEDGTGINGADYCARLGTLRDRNDSVIQPPYYLITHDYPGGGHSNWFGPFSCGQVTAIPTNSNWGLLVLMAMFLTFGLLVVRGRMA